MEINLRKLKSSRESLCAKLEEKLSDVLTDDFVFALDLPETPSQYWEWGVIVWSDDETWAMQYRAKTYYTHLDEVYRKRSKYCVLFL